MLVEKSSGDNHRVGAESASLDPFGGVIRGHQDIAILAVSTCAFDGANEIEAPLYEGLGR